MNKILFFFIVFFVNTSVAQDVIVKKDGSTIISKVLEVNTDDIKYKKFSNQNGPTYSIIKSEIYAINYENGEKDVFDNLDSQTISETDRSQVLSETDSESELYNRRYVDTYNNLKIEFVDNHKDKGKKADGSVCLIGIKEGSTMYNQDLLASIIIGGIDIGKTDQFTTKSDGSFSDRRLVVFHLTNNTDKMLYIDMANTFFIRNNIPEPYYEPTATSKTSGKASGVALNLGAVAGALGIGGALGTLADGINVGSSNTNSTTTTTFSKRVYAIPPKSALALAPRWLIPKNTHPYPNMSGDFVLRHKFSNLH